ncbi:hypothetical protein BOTBODRAFT_49677 [Botryobasidium botryosum FD-172 SS1]|uniref:Uncharacterized protein n=1 Tax=Botryobasidium botryosum (strain FD-172 SS1) TaxID=930990 RepID=A0A067M2R1_BOTB1|nr:hypothetical protein BOTBODRAFT_49677 [Botryobasidium botryosum FD-172 SS1]
MEDGSEASIDQTEELEKARRRGKTLRHKYATNGWLDGERDTVSAAVLEQSHSLRSRDMVRHAVQKLGVGEEKIRGGARGGSHIVLPEGQQPGEPLFHSLALPGLTLGLEGEGLVDAFQELGNFSTRPGTRSENEALHLLLWSKSAIFPFLTAETRVLLEDIQAREALIKLVALVKNVSLRVGRVMLELDPAYATAAQQICDYALAWYQKGDGSFNPDLGGLATALAAKAGGSPYAHLDPGDWGLAILYVSGLFTGGNFVLPQMGIAIPFGGLTVLLIRASELIHFVSDLEGYRVILTTFIDLNTAVHAGSQEGQFWEAPKAAAALGAAKDARAAARRKVENLRNEATAARVSKEKGAATRNACLRALQRAQKKVRAGREGQHLAELTKAYEQSVEAVAVADSAIQQAEEAVMMAQKEETLRAADVAAAEDALDDAEIKYRPWLQHIHTPARLARAAKRILAKRRKRIETAREALCVTLSGATGKGVKTETVARAALQSAQEAEPIAEEQVRRTHEAELAGVVAHDHWRACIYPLALQLGTARRSVHRWGKILIEASAEEKVAAGRTHGVSLEEGQRMEFEAMAARGRAARAKTKAEQQVAQLAEQLRLRQERWRGRLKVQTDVREHARGIEGKYGAGAPTQAEKGYAHWLQRTDF